MDQITKFLTRARTWFVGLPSNKRTSLIVSVALSLALASVLWGVASYDPLVILFTEPLSPAEASEVLDHLVENKVDYQIEPSSQRIKVPRSKKERIAMELRDDILSHQACGFINDTPLGTTQSMERLLRKLALQCEIEVQINKFDQILGASVLLTTPEAPLFDEDRVEPSASVHLELRSGATLSTSEGLRIATMVAAAVEGLTSDRVAISDDKLRVIHAMQESGDEIGASSELAREQRNHNDYYTRRIERLLEPILGLGNVRASVNVKLDHSERTNSKHELRGDDSALVSSRYRETSTSGGATAGGVPGTTANSPELSGVNSRGSRSSSEADEVSNFDVPEENSFAASEPGQIIAMTASVLVDGSWAVSAATDAAPAVDGEDAAAAPAEKVYTPRTAEQLAEYRALVAGSLGIALADVTMINQQFVSLDLTPSAVTTRNGGAAWTEYLPWGALALVILLSFLLVVRPVMKGIAAQPAEELADEAAQALPDGGVAGMLEEPEEEEDLQHQLLTDWLDSIASGNRGFVTRSEVTRLVRTDLVHSVVTLQNWIAEETV